jgi:hypothetical protein
LKKIKILWKGRLSSMPLIAWPYKYLVCRIVCSHHISSFLWRCRTLVLCSSCIDNIVNIQSGIP